MTRQEFEALRRGDIVRERSGLRRVVLGASQRDGKTYAITLRIERDSWRAPCIFTTLNVHDARTRLTATGERMRRVPHLVCPHPRHQDVHAACRP